MIYDRHPDLVILDMMMPRKGATTVLEHFRDKESAPPIIMITANEGSRHKAYAGIPRRHRLHPQAVRDGKAPRSRRQRGLNPSEEKEPEKK